MRRTIAALALTALLGSAAGAILAAPAPAAGLAPAVADCNQHGRLTRHYSVVALRTALATMPAEIAEYTDCHDVIQRQLLAQLGQLHGDGGSSHGGGSLVPVWLIVVLALLAAAAATLGALAIRERRRTPPLH